VLGCHKSPHFVPPCRGSGPWPCTLGPYRSAENSLCRPSQSKVFTSELVPPGWPCPRSCHRHGDPWGPWWHGQGWFQQREEGPCPAPVPATPAAAQLCTAAPLPAHGFAFPSGEGGFQPESKWPPAPLQGGEDLGSPGGAGWAHGVISCPSSAAESGQLITRNPAFADAARVCARARLVLPHRSPPRGIVGCLCVTPCPPATRCGSEVTAAIDPLFKKLFITVCSEPSRGLGPREGVGIHRASGVPQLGCAGGRAPDVVTPMR